MHSIGIVLLFLLTGLLEFRAQASTQTSFSQCVTLLQNAISDCAQGGSSCTNKLCRSCLMGKLRTDPLSDCAQARTMLRSLERMNNS
ncbi:hypothetical protein D915_007876 [Fasciola hepatica]|uniref:Uncharacterized protein n=1 Tax=Fasciola hepatica TaxID=6192 RepID=A0A4E0RUK5_FASHE|nr:hypothetical protein D915_007876 [Fasciola hepatica]